MEMNMDNHIYEVAGFKDLKEMLNRSVSLYGSQPVFYDKNKETRQFEPTTYQELYDTVNQLGTFFYGKGFGTDRIAVMGENRKEWCMTFLAVLCGGGVIVPVDKDVPAEDAVNILNVSEAKIFIFSGKKRKMVLENREKLRNKDLILIDMDAREEAEGILSFAQCVNAGRLQLEAGADAYLKAEIDPEILSNLIFTSGTTGMAKGVMLCQRNICSNIRSILMTVRITEEDRLLSVLPLHHTYESTIGFLCAVYSGSSIIFCEGLKYINKNMLEMHPTVLVTVPLLLENLHKKVMKSAGAKKGGMAKLKFGKALAGSLKAVGIDKRKDIFKDVHNAVGGQLRLVITGAAAIRPEVSKDLRKFGFKVLQGYGLTECSPLALGNNDKAYKDDSVGFPIPDVEVKIDNPDEKGIGEIIIKGPNVMLGYYNDPETTQAVMRDGWFHSGDLGVVDKNGYFKITGRIKNVIVTKNGKNIYPEELEYFLNSSPFIEECIVWGEEEENETVVKAQIFPNIEAIKEFLKINTRPSQEEVDKIIDEAVKEANTKVPLYKRIKGFSIRDTEFVKTTTKKIKRYLETGNKKDGK